MSYRRHDTIDKDKSSIKDYRLLPVYTHNIAVQPYTEEQIESMSKGFYYSDKFSRKLDILNIIFERYHDDRIGGVREDKLVRLVYATCTHNQAAQRLCDRLQLSTILLGQSSEERRYRRIMLKNDNIRVFVWGTFINMFASKFICYMSDIKETSHIFICFIGENIQFIESMLTAQSIFKSRRQAYRARVREKLNTHNFVPRNLSKDNSFFCNVLSSDGDNEKLGILYENDRFKEPSVTETTTSLSPITTSCNHDKELLTYPPVVQEKHLSFSSNKSYSSDLQGEDFITHRNQLPGLALAYSSSSVNESNCHYTSQPLRSELHGSKTCKIFNYLRKGLTMIFPFLQSKHASYQNVESAFE